MEEPPVRQCAPPRALLKVRQPLQTEEPVQMPQQQSDPSVQAKGMPVPAARSLIAESHLRRRAQQEGAMSAIGILKHTCQLLHVSANRIFREPIPVGLIMRVGPAWPALVVRARRFVGLVEQPVGNQCCCVTEGRRSAGESCRPGRGHRHC